MAPAAPDAHDLVDDDATANEDPESIVVRAAIPTVAAYEHIHFGVWASLGDADEMDGSQSLAALGLGFVQNISDSGITDRLGIGTVTYEGNWVANVQRQNAAAGTGAINPEQGDATLTANFDEDEFTGNLMALPCWKARLTATGSPA